MQKWGREIILFTCPACGIEHEYHYDTPGERERHEALRRGHDGQLYCLDCMEDAAAEANAE
jgi:hypothetical protein